MIRIAACVAGAVLAALAIAEPTYIPGDYDLSGALDFADVASYTTCLAGPAAAIDGGCAECDAESDNDVDLADLAAIAPWFGAIDCRMTATASSVENNDPQLAADRAVDGNYVTRWASAFADNQWLQIDFGRPRELHSVWIHWETAYASEYRVLTAPEGGGFTEVYYTSSGDGGSDETAFASRTARYVRIECLTRATEWGNSIWEVRPLSDDMCYDPAAGATSVDQLVAAMTLEEKTSYVYGEWYMNLRAIPRLGIPAFNFADGPVGYRYDGSHVNPSPIRAEATAFPASIALGATWDVELAERFGQAIGREWRNKGRQVWLGPCVGVIRVPHGGRNFETYGEDPCLNGRLAVASIQGVQSEGVVACVKHYAANNQEYNRGSINIEVDERPLREIYLRVFEQAVIEGGAWSVMAAYNRVNGPYCTASSFLLQDVLKDEWGFPGFVVSDWGAVHATAETANAGLDVEMDASNPVGNYWGAGQLRDAVLSGAVAEATVDDKVRRILLALDFTGAMDEPWTAPDEYIAENWDLAREIAAEGTVLFKNVGAVLPLDRSIPQTIAVMGPNYRDARVGGGGSSTVTPYYTVSPIDGLRSLAGPNVTFDEHTGVTLPDTPPPPVDSAWLTPPGGVGSGLLGQYYANTDLQGTPVLTREDAQVDFDWGEGSPGTGVGSDNFSVRWTGSLSVPTSATYELATSTDDGVRLWLNGTQLIDDWNGHAVEVNSVSVNLTAGVSYDIVMEYFEGGGSAVARLSCYNAATEFAAAVSAAASADAALVFVGLSNVYESEGFDRPTMDLDADQVSLIQSVSAANPNTVVVIIAGSQVGMGAWVDEVPAVLQAWYPGQEGGIAIANVLFGDVNPSGRLPMTFVREWADHPCFLNYPGGVYSEGLFVGYRHFDTFGVAPLFPFGHGLSYTTFGYNNLIVDASQLAATGSVGVTVDVQNTGAVTGAEVVQVYVRDVTSSVARPDKELRAFAKIALAPAETQTVSLALDARDFAYWSPAAHDWVIEPGQFEILVGASAGDIRLSATFDHP